MDSSTFIPQIQLSIAIIQNSFHCRFFFFFFGGGGGGENIDSSNEWF
jgi:hypothetical protein